MTSSPNQPVRIPDDLLAEICGQARSAFPEECCGYLRAESRAASSHNRNDNNRNDNNRNDNNRNDNNRNDNNRNDKGGAPLVARELVRCRNAQGDGAHPTHAERGAEAGFVIAGRELFDFARAFSSDRPPCVVYHSHTNGRAYFSAVDRENAVARGADGIEHPTYPVQHLVLGVTAGGVAEIAMFAWDSTTRDFVEVSRVVDACCSAD